MSPRVFAMAVLFLYRVETPPHTTSCLHRSLARTAWYARMASLAFSFLVGCMLVWCVYLNPLKDARVATAT